MRFFFGADWELYSRPDPASVHSSIDQTTQESRLTETKVNAIKDRKVCGDDSKF